MALVTVDDLILLSCLQVYKKFSSQQLLGQNGKIRNVLYVLGIAALSHKAIALKTIRPTKATTQLQGHHVLDGVIEEFPKHEPHIVIATRSTASSLKPLARQG